MLTHSEWYGFRDRRANRYTNPQNILHSEKGLDAKERKLTTKLIKQHTNLIGGINDLVNKIVFLSNYNLCCCKRRFERLFIQLFYVIGSQGETRTHGLPIWIEKQDLNLHQRFFLNYSLISRGLKTN